MRGLVKFIIALAVSLLLMIAFRALVITIYTVEGDGFAPVLDAGDHILVNRWSYGLRAGSNGGLFSYGRIGRQDFERGDIVAYEDPSDSTHTRVLFGKLSALPGDTIRYRGELELVPSLTNCADADYFWLQALSDNNPIDSRYLGFISEQYIIGRAFLVIYSHNPKMPIWKGYNPNRWFVLP